MTPALDDDLFETSDDYFAEDWGQAWSEVNTGGMRTIILYPADGSEPRVWVGKATDADGAAAFMVTADPDDVVQVTNGGEPDSVADPETEGGSAGPPGGLDEVELPAAPAEPPRAAPAAPAEPPRAAPAAPAEPPRAAPAAPAESPTQRALREARQELADIEAKLELARVRARIEQARQELDELEGTGRVGRRARARQAVASLFGIGRRK